MTEPTLAEQIAAIEDVVAMLRRSYTDQIGPTKGQITEPGIADQIAALNATLALLKKEIQARKSYGYCINCGCRPCICATPEPGKRQRGRGAMPKF